MGDSFHCDLDVLRALALRQPGPLPVALNATIVAASIRPNRFVIEDGDDSPISMPRTAYQLVYEAGTVMLDSGLDKQTHDSFASPQAEPEPYYEEEFARLREALHAARAIILTHYHADHVAGVVAAPNRDELAVKTFATAHTLRLMIEQPHRPHLALSRNEAARFLSFDYDRCMPLMPGLVMIKTPGHTPDSQSLFIRLADGREFLHSVDTAWNMQNIIQMKGKAAPWVKENPEQIAAQLAWLNGLHRTAPEVAILVTHDETRLAQLVAEGLVGRTLAR